MTGWKIRKLNYNCSYNLMLSSGAVRAFIFATCFFLSGCGSEVLEKQAEQLRRQEIELARQRKEIDDLLAGQKLEAQKSRDCNRAFREYFEKAQAASEPKQRISLYRQGLDLCPDDDVAHYELGKVLAAQGLYAEAQTEFEAALKINPDFADAKRQLDTVRQIR